VRDHGVLVGGIVGHAAGAMAWSGRREGGFGLWSRGIRANEGRAGNHFEIGQMTLFSSRGIV